MEKEHVTTQNNQSFSDFIFREKANRQYLLIALGAMVLQLIIFKLLYPFADFFSDSYSYIMAAQTNANISIWPVGYSKFLRAFHLITHSDTALVSFQYIFLELSFLYCFFTLRYFYQPGKSTSQIIFAFLFFNPLFLYLSNYVSSDPLFLALSILWFTQLLRIIHRPVWHQVITHGILLTILFTIRYNAMYYPLVTAAAFVLSRRPVMYKIAGIILPVALITGFVNFSRNEAEKLTGTKQFSLFSGWQLANNALYMYPYIKVDDSKIPVISTAFHQQVKTYFDTVSAASAGVSPTEGAYYIKYPGAPLKQHLFAARDAHPDMGIVELWGRSAAIFGVYGNALIKDHPIAFFRYFLLPNSYNFILPPLEKLEVYNTGDNEVSESAQEWFDYKSTHISAVTPELQTILLWPFPALLLIIHVLYILYFIQAIRYRKQLKQHPELYGSLILSAILFLGNAGFGILASPIVFRYEIFTMITALWYYFLLREKLTAPAVDSTSQKTITVTATAH
ncbi:hypothetical protein ECE50_008885 [Chitinophaga sp. Mgbs1]|uniref:Uncharacterized protein n=1 Tax=Chitinophaga solisilvae TaxID=1233460 RepID=A0A9Q5D9B7_9BACT|nr:hypothetical protein [Chitinophaga solisilvae]